MNAGTPAGTLITNQATVGTAELPNLLTDGDGNPATGPEPTVVVVGAGQQLTIDKQVVVVGGGAALAGGQLEYIVTVRNVASVPATNVVITDDFAPLVGRLTYVPASGTLNGLPTGVVFAGNLLTADYSANYGPLAPGATAVLRFRANIDGGLATGTNITNTGTVTWNAPAQTASASVTIAIGGMPGVGLLSGRIWHDIDFDDAFGGGDLALELWNVELLRNGTVGAHHPERRHGSVDDDRRAAERSERRPVRPAVRGPGRGRQHGGPRPDELRLHGRSPADLGRDRAFGLEPAEPEPADRPRTASSTARSDDSPWTARR